MDVSLRGAVSIARRLQDPLAELVKIDPKSIGVGQYQHDLSEVQAVPLAGRGGRGLRERGRRRPEHRVRAAAGPGVGHQRRAWPRTSWPTATRNGPFRTRAGATRCRGSGPKAFEQCAGFLRIPDGDDPLDASSVHPEAYPVVRRILTAAGRRHARPDRQHARCCATLQPAEFVDDTFGLPTVTDILTELEKPGRDPRPAFKTATFAEGVEKLGRPDAGHGAGGRGHQRGRVRRVRRHRRAPGRAGARLGDVAQLRQGPARGRQVRATSSGSRCSTSTCPRKRISLTLRLDDEEAPARRPATGPGSDQARSDQAPGDRPRKDQPRRDQPRGGQPRQDQPRTGRQPRKASRADEPRRDQPRGGRPGGGTPPASGAMADALRRAGLTDGGNGPDRENRRRPK